MPDKKNVVDDYYSSISSDNSSASDTSTKSQKAIKIKPKKLIKKIIPIVQEDIVADKEIVNEKITQEKKSSGMRVISRVRDEKKPIGGNKTFFKKDDNSRNLDTNKFKKPIVSSNDVKPKQGTNSGYSTLKPKTKVFTNDKTTAKKFDDKPRKRGLSPYHPKKSRGRFSFFEEEKDSGFVRSTKINKKKKEEKNVEDIRQNLVDRSGQTVTVPDVLNLKVFSEKMGIVLPKLIAEFMKNGLMVNINSKIDFDSASIIAEAFDIKIERDTSSGMSVEDVLEGNLSELLVEEDSSKLKPRSPVISIMGHVDHGKTSLLDYIRESKVADKEAGGITQSIGAYQVTQNGQKITFLDTPGHEAFTIMRARGAKSTDIAVLVVASDEGVKPQTIESINHAKQAEIPVIVAINKMDKEGANPDHVKGQLSENGLTPEDWGGDTPMIPVSAITGFGIDELLEMILLVSEMKDLKANPDRKGVATVIESHLDTKLGPVATVLVNTGTINNGENIVCKGSYGKVKIMKDYTGKNIKKASIGDPVLIVGLSGVVEGGDVLQVVSSVDIAREKSIEYEQIMHRRKEVSSSGIDLLMSKIKAGSLKQLKIVLKADTNGSLEAIKGSLLKLSTEETNISIIHSGVGNISEGDILMCEGSEAILIGFGVSILSTAKNHLELSGIEYMSSNIIYHITERIEKIITGMLDLKEVEVILGKATVKEIFYDSKEFMIVGLGLLDENKIETKAKIRVIRNKKLVGKGEVNSLKKGVEEVKMLDGPTECGIKFIGDIKVEQKDELELYKIEIQK